MDYSSETAKFALNMELKDVVSVSGMPGLHKIIGRNKNGLIVESIGDNKKFATNLRQRVSILSDIAIFTEDGEARLWEVLKAIKALDDSGKSIPDGKSDNDVARQFMKEVLPTYDTEKVYVSDMKKLYAWYHTLKPVLDFSKLGEEENTEESADKAGDAPVKKAEKAAPKKNTAKTSGPKPVAGAKTKTTTPRKMGS